MEFCETCCDALVQKIPHSCVRCAAAVGPHSATENGCVHCRGRKFRFQSVTCLGMYEGKLRDSILLSKWSRSGIQVGALTQLLIAEHIDELRHKEFNLIIPVPQSWDRRLFRSFNAADLIALELARKLQISADRHILRRSRRTRLQKRVSVTKRFENQKGSFRLRDAHLLKNANVLLIDDVLTTGATCSEAARILRQAGAASCHVAVIARVLDHSA